MTERIRTLTLVVASIAIVLVTLVSVTAPAAISTVRPAAAAWRPPCAAGELCVASGYNGMGTIGSFRCCAPDLSRFGLNKNISSIWNRSDDVWCLYWNKNYTSPVLATSPDDGPRNLAPDEDNKVSSLSRNQCP